MRICVRPGGLGSRMTANSKEIDLHNEQLTRKFHIRYALAETKGAADSKGSAPSGDPLAETKGAADLKGSAHSGDPRLKKRLPLWSVFV